MAARKKPKYTHTDVTFKVQANRKIGDELYVTGDCQALGAGDVAQAVQLYNKPDRPREWFTRHPLQIERDRPVSYKYMILSGGDFQRFEHCERTLRCTGRFRVVSDVLDAPGDHIDDGGRSEASSARSSHSGAGSAGLVGAGEFADGPWRRHSVARSSDMGDDFDDVGASGRLASENTIIIATYHLPVKVSYNEERKHWRVRFDDEHLLSRKHRHALGNRAIWVGTLDMDLPAGQEPLLRQALWRKKCVPVFLSREERGYFEQGMCKDTLWSVLHNIVGVYGDKPSRWVSPKLQERRWDSYMHVNKQFADAICSRFHTGDMVWVHDYHLLMCPRYIMKVRGDANVGLFVHTPFPSSEIFRTLSCRAEILNGMLAANHIGFRLYEYARHFVSSCMRVGKFTHENLPGGCMAVNVDDRQVKITVSQVGIEPEVIKRRLAQETVQARSAAMRKRYAGADGSRTVIVGVENVHRLAGIPLKLEGFDRFLRLYPEFIDKVVLVQVGTGAFRSEETKDNPLEDIQRRTKSINDRYGPVVHFEHRVSMSLADRAELFLAGDVFLNTCIRDGLNQHPMEYVFAQSRRDAARQAGALICSEFAGVSRVLGGSQRINPWQADEVARELLRALRMSRAERQKRHDSDMQWVMANTTTDWATRILEDLSTCATGDDPPLAGGGHIKKRRGFGDALGKATEITIGDKLLDEKREMQVVREFSTSSKRCIILDYGGTLADGEAAHVTDEGGITAKTTPLSKEMSATLKSLSTDPANTVFVVSGHPRKTLSRVFKHLPNVGLAAENGYLFKWGARAPGGSLGTIGGLGESGTSGNDSTEDFDGLRRSDSMDDTEVRINDVRGHAKKGWNIIQQHLDMSWLDIAANIMKIYSKNTNGTYLLRKSSSIVWYFGQAEEEFGRSQANELSAHLRGVLSSFNVKVLKAAQYVEVRPNGVNKGKMVEKVLEQLKYDVDFVLCIGDDMSDEKMFDMLNKRSGMSVRGAGQRRRTDSSGAPRSRERDGALIGSSGGDPAFGGTFARESSLSGPFMASLGGSMTLDDIDEAVAPSADAVSGGAAAGAGAGAGEGSAPGAGPGYTGFPGAPSHVVTGAVAPSSPGRSVTSASSDPATRPGLLVRSSSLRSRQRLNVRFSASVGEHEFARDAPRAPASLAPAPKSPIKDPLRSPVSPKSPKSPSTSPGGRFHASMPTLSLAGKPEAQLLVRPWTVTVGMKNSKARFYVNEMSAVQDLLAMLSAASQRALKQRRVRSMVDLPSRGFGGARLGPMVERAPAPRAPMNRERSMMFSTRRTGLRDVLPASLAGPRPDLTYDKFLKPDEGTGGEKTETGFGFGHFGDVDDDEEDNFF